MQAESRDWEIQVRLDFYIFRMRLCVGDGTQFVAYILSLERFMRKDQGGGGGIRTHEPLRDGITHFAFFSPYVLREEMVSRTSDLESCAFDQASLPLHSLVLPVKPYFIVAADKIRLI